MSNRSRKTFITASLIFLVLIIFNINVGSYTIITGLMTWGFWVFSLWVFMKLVWPRIRYELEAGRDLRERLQKRSVDNQKDDYFDHYNEDDDEFYETYGEDKDENSNTERKKEISFLNSLLVDKKTKNPKTKYSSDPDSPDFMLLSEHERDVWSNVVSSTLDVEYDKPTPLYHFNPLSIFVKKWRK